MRAGYGRWAGSRVVCYARRPPRTTYSLRGLVNYVSEVADADIPRFELPTGQPLVYELDAALKPVSRTFLEG